MHPHARYALYYVPPETSPWWHFGNRWLGRNPSNGGVPDAPRQDGLSTDRQREITAGPRHYGFHGTLKPPFSLAPGRSEPELLEAVCRFSDGRPAFALPDPRVRALGSLLAVRPCMPCPEMEALAADSVRHFDSFRAPPEQEELERRRAAGLSDRQVRNLERWGYPYVLEDFRFHMTLTQSLESPERERMLEGLEALTASWSGQPLRVDAIAVFGQRSRAHPFQMLWRAGFNGVLEMLPVMLP